eukprot:TRINITY_DN29075_c0_g1_i1.p1 TRINITY_DN29075_c0_g1~~TRINITY_DN29075_c0_g1_i1.p1  ORF type:complete len:265 (+),score=62.28 TRINITY_DN29075_c0_g1_i1:107-901(+)
MPSHRQLLGVALAWPLSGTPVDASVAKVKSSCQTDFAQLLPADQGMPCWKPLVAGTELGPCSYNGKIEVCTQKGYEPAISWYVADLPDHPEEEQFCETSHTCEKKSDGHWLCHTGDYCQRFSNYNMVLEIRSEKTHEQVCGWKMLVELCTDQCGYGGFGTRLCGDSYIGALGYFLIFGFLCQVVGTCGFGWCVFKYCKPPKKSPQKGKALTMQIGVPEYDAELAKKAKNRQSREDAAGFAQISWSEKPEHPNIQVKRPLVPDLE